MNFDKQTLLNDFISYGLRLATRETINKTLKKYKCGVFRLGVNTKIKDLNCRIIFKVRSGSVFAIKNYGDGLQ